MAARVTQKDLDHTIDLLNSRLAGMKSRKRYRAQHRYDYWGLDEYEIDAAGRYRMLRGPLATGSKRDIDIYATAMLQTLDLVSE